MKMLLIHRVHAQEVDGPVHVIATRTRLGILQEEVVGRTFVDLDGQKRCVGMTEECQEKIGIVFDAFSDMADEIRSLKETCVRKDKVCDRYILKTSELTTKINEIAKADWRTRLKWLFTGVKV